MSAPRHDPYAPLRLPAVRYYLSGWLLMIVGGQIRSLTVGVEIYDKTKDPTALGLSGLALALPVILFSLVGGAIADRYDRRKVTMASIGLTTLLSAALIIVSAADAPAWAFYVALFLLGTVSALGLPARSAMLPNMVPRHLLPSATTWNSSTFQTASIAGPIAGGLLLTFGYPVCYAVTTVMGLLFLWQLYRLEGQFTPKAAGSTPPADDADEGSPEGAPLQQAPPAATSSTPAPAIAPPSLSPIRSLLEGLRFVLGTRVLFAVILLDLLAVVLGGVIYVLPVFQKEILGISDAQLGLLRAAEYIGGLTFGLVAAQFPPFRNAGRTLLISVFCFGLCIIGFGLSRNFLLSFTLLFLAGAFDNVSVIVRHTLVGLLAPDHMRGRVNAVNAVFIGSSNELGGFRAGLMADAIGPVRSVVVGGIGTLASVLMVGAVFKSVRRLGSLAGEAKKP